MEQWIDALELPPQLPCYDSAGLGIANPVPRHSFPTLEWKTALPILVAYPCRYSSMRARTKINMPIHLPRSPVKPWSIAALATNSVLELLMSRHLILATSLRAFTQRLDESLFLTDQSLATFHAAVLQNCLLEDIVLVRREVHENTSGSVNRLRAA